MAGGGAAWGALPAGGWLGVPREATRAVSGGSVSRRESLRTGVVPRGPTCRASSRHRDLEAIGEDLHRPSRPVGGVSGAYPVVVRPSRAPRTGWRELLDGLPERLLPVGLDRKEIGVLGEEPPMASDPERVARVDQQVDRGTDRHVGAHGRVERDERVAGRVVQRRAVVTGLPGRGWDARTCTRRSGGTASPPSPAGDCPGGRSGRDHGPGRGSARRGSRGR